MSHRHLPTGVPCGVCLTRITGWCPVGDGGAQAVPCGHTPAQIAVVAATATPVTFGQFNDRWQRWRDTDGRVWHREPGGWLECPDDVVRFETLGLLNSLRGPLVPVDGQGRIRPLKQATPTGPPT